MNPVILVPYRPGRADRDRLWRYSQSLLAQSGRVVSASNPDSEPFSRAHSLNLAAAGGWDVAYVTDIDKVPCDAKQIRHALAAAFHTHRYVLGRSVLRYLTPRSTEKVLRGLDPCEADWDEEQASWDDTFAVSRRVWDDVGGFDERIVGYGGSGVAFAAAAGTLHGRAQISGVTVHLWHEPHPGRLADIERNEPLVGRYRDADGDPDEMRLLLEEPR